MFWKLHSWKAITCCVSKGILILVAIGIVIGIVIGAMALISTSMNHRSEMRDQRKYERCRWLISQIYDSQQFGKYTRSQMQSFQDEYQNNCLEKPDEPTRKTSMWFAGFFWGTLGFIAISLLLLHGICSDTIAYCQAAVDTGRNPWYWLPRIGDRLPPWEMNKCESCGHKEPETEDQYRVRLGLLPLNLDKEK